MKKSSIYGQERCSTLNLGKSLSKMKPRFPERLQKQPCKALI